MDKVSIRQIKQVFIQSHTGLGNREATRVLHISSGRVIICLTQAIVAGLV